MRDAAPSFERPYNLKIGPIAFTAGMGLGFEYVDNLNQTNGQQESDLVITPSISVTGVWQVSRLNSLEIRGTFGYTKFVNNPELDSPGGTVSPDSLIRLNVFVGDIKFVIREGFSLQNDTFGVGGVGGVAQLGRFNNIVGVTALWDLNDILWTLSLDRSDLITTGNTRNTEGELNDFSQLDRNTHQVSTSLMFRLAPTVSLGLEGAFGYTAFPKNSSADSTFYSIGPVLQWQISNYTNLTIGAGWQAYTSDNDQGSDTLSRDNAFGGTGGLGGLGGVGAPGNSSAFGVTGPRRTGAGDSYYFNIALNHRLNRFYTDSFSIFREVQTGLLADRTETFGIAYSSQWVITSRINLSTSLFYQNIHDTAQDSGLATAQPDFQRFGVNIGTGFQLTRKLGVSLRYTYSRETSDLQTRTFAQNRFGVTFGYQF